MRSGSLLTRHNEQACSLVQSQAWDPQPEPSPKPISSKLKLATRNMEAPRGTRGSKTMLPLTANRRGTPTAYFSIKKESGKKGFFFLLSSSSSYKTNLCLAQCSHSFCEPQAGPRHAGHRDEAPEKPGGGLVNWRAPMNHCSFLPVSFSAGKPPRASLPRTPSAQHPGHGASERQSKRGFPGPLKRQGGPSD